MLIDELEEQLRNLEPDIKTIVTFWNNSGLEHEFMNLQTQSEQVDFWQNPRQAELLKELQRIRLLRDQYLYITSTQKELPELIELFQDDQVELAKQQYIVLFLLHLLDRVRIAERIHGPRVAVSATRPRLIPLRFSFTFRVWQLPSGFDGGT